MNVKDSRIARCETALSSSGPQRSLSYIDSCVALDCNRGVSIRFGKTDVIVVNTRFSCSDVGVYINWDVVGNVDFVDCAFSGMRPDCECVDWSTDRCALTVDNVARPSKSMKVIMAKANKHIEEEDPILSLRRWYKLAGVCDVICENCGKVEPADVRFKVCARCKWVCYCSKECQVRNFVFSIFIVCARLIKCCICAGY